MTHDIHPDITDAGAAQALLEHGGFVHTLARRLVRDACEADDLAQEAWLVALRRRAADIPDPTRWFARTLRTRAGNRRRAQARRRHREQVAARGIESSTAPAAAELVERMEIRHRVVTAVLALEEPYRSTVIRRFEEGWTPTRIARETGVPLDTVKSRLRRALEELRERLDREAGGDGRRWLTGLVLVIEDDTSLVAGTGTILSIPVLLGTVAAALLVALATWWGWSGSGGAVAGAEPEVATSAAKIAAGSEPETSPRDPARALLPPIREEAPTLALRIVDAITREPIASARVWHATREELDRGSEEGSMRGRLPLVGRLLTSDPDGMVTVPLGEIGTVWARHGDRDATATIGPGDLEPHDLGLSPSRTLRVHVTDARGNPAAGVPVHLSTGDDPRPWSFAFAITRDDGTALFHDLEEHARNAKLGATWRVRPEIPAAALPAESFAVEAWPSEPLSLSLPPTGRVEVRFTYEDGSIPTRKLPVRVARGTGSSGSDRMVSLQSLETVRDGTLILPHVGVNERLDITFSHGATRSRLPSYQVDGPEVLSEAVTRHVVLVEDALRMRGRLVTEEGDPIVTRELSVDVHCRVGNRSFPSLDLFGSTDDDGRFELVHPSWGPGIVPARLRIAVASTLDAPIRLATLEAPRLTPEHVLELEDVVVTVPSGTARGRVLDEEGEGIAAARIDVRVKETPVPSRSLPRRRGDPGGRGKLVSPQTPDPFLEGTSRRHGHFDLALEADRDGYEIRALAPGFAPGAWHAVAPGDEGIELRLHRASTIAGSFRLPDALPFDELRFGLDVPGRHDLANLFSGYLTSDAGGHFRKSDLAPGFYDFQVSLRGEPTPLVTIAGIEVPPGTLVRDPRLQEIDLDAVLEVVAVEIVDDRGAPIPGGMIRLLAEGESAPADRATGEGFSVPGIHFEGSSRDRRSIEFRAGKTRFVARPGPVRAEVTARGFQSCRIEDLRSEGQVVLVRQNAVHFTLPADLELPPAPWRLEVIFLAPSSSRSNGTTGSFLSFGSLTDTDQRPRHRIDESRAFSLPLSESGSWRVQWLIRGEVTHRLPSTGIEVPADPGSKAIVIEPSRHDYERILGELR